MSSVDSKQLSELINSCKKGDRNAQRVIYEKYYPLFIISCARYFANIEEAKDACQEGFVKVFMNIEKYNSDGSFEGWARRIVVNTAIDAFRKNKKYSFTSLDSSDYVWLEAEDDSEIQWNEVLFKEKDRVLEAVNNLTPAYKAVFMLYVIEDYSHKEIAEMLGVSEGTSKSNLAKAKQNLKKALKALAY